MNVEELPMLIEQRREAFRMYAHLVRPQLPETLRGIIDFVPGEAPPG